MIDVLRMNNNRQRKKNMKAKRICAMEAARGVEEDEKVSMVM